MRKSLALLVVTVMVSICGAAVAQIKAPDPAPPEAVSRYVIGTRLGYITCSDKYRDYVDKYERFALVNEGQNTVTGLATVGRRLSGMRAGNAGQGPRHVRLCLQADVDHGFQRRIEGLSDGMGEFAVDARAARRRETR